MIEIEILRKNHALVDLDYWLNMIKYSWRYDPKSNNHIFSFKNKSDAIMFKLSWG